MNSPEVKVPKPSDCSRYTDHLYIHCSEIVRTEEIGTSVYFGWKYKIVQQLKKAGDSSSKS